MDISAGRRLIVVGSLNVDLISYVPRFPAPGETLVGSSFQQGCGGKGANQACAAALLCGGAGAVAMVGAVGDDALGADYVRVGGCFAGSGVDVSGVAVARGVSTGVAPIWVNAEGENCIVVVPGANETVTAADVEAALDASGRLACAAGVVVQCEVPLAATAAALRRASGAGVATFWTPAPVPPGGLPDTLLAHASVLIPNRGELLALAGGAAAAAAAAEPGVSAAALAALCACAATLQSRGARSVVVTLGADGALVVGAGGNASALVRAPRVAAVDTSGAGDAFSGALAFFVCARAAPFDVPFDILVDAARRAACVAALSVTKKGTQQSYAARRALPPSLFADAPWGEGSAAEFAAWVAGGGVE
jgi:ribokinase